MRAGHPRRERPSGAPAMCNVQGPSMFIYEKLTLVACMRVWTWPEHIVYDRLVAQLVEHMFYEISNGFYIGREPRHRTVRILLNGRHTLHAFVQRREDENIRVYIIGVVFDDDGAPYDPDPNIGRRRSRATFIIHTSGGRGASLTQMSGRTIARLRDRRYPGVTIKLIIAGRQNLIPHLIQPERRHFSATTNSPNHRIGASINNISKSEANNYQNASDFTVELRPTPASIPGHASHVLVSTLLASSQPPIFAPNFKPSPALLITANLGMLDWRDTSRALAPRGFVQSRGNSSLAEYPLF